MLARTFRSSGGCDPRSHPEHRRTPECSSAAIPTSVDVAIIGAGPYGLSIAAYLHDRGRSICVFGSPMGAWRDQMPRGMHLKSAGFASDLYAPGLAFTLGDYCAERGLAYHCASLPVSLETFVAYGMEFQRRRVHALVDSSVTSLAPASGGFELRSSIGHSVRARRVIVAVGVSHFAHLPHWLLPIPQRWVSHSSQCADPGQFKGQRVAVVGGGASAVDLAALLHAEGAAVELLARGAGIDFHRPPVEARTLLRRLLEPGSGLGLGWRSRLCSDAPDLFHALPERLRLRIVANHLGPAAGWFMRDHVVGRFPIHFGATVETLRVMDRQAHLRVRYSDGQSRERPFDHVIAATGYRVDLSRLGFVDDRIRARLRVVGGAPVLDHHFESSVPGLHFVGPASASSFGPLMRFACGANFTARRLANAFAGFDGRRSRS